LREARAASACDHPNICTIYEIDETDDGQMYLAMAYYDGETLKERTARGALRVAAALNVAIQASQGLAPAHEAGLVHRDIKPANLILTRRGEVKIVDFGLAKLVREAHLTQTGVTLGTVAYMSPEQARGQDVDHRADIWALGVVLYEMICGRRPFLGDSAQVVLLAILESEPAPLWSPLEPLPDALEGIVMRALAKPRSERYQHMTHMLRDLVALKRLVSGESADAIDLPAVAPATSPACSSAAVTVVDAGTPSIAVLPFADLSPGRDQAWFCEGVAEEIITALAKLQGLRVVARTSAFQFKDQTPDVRHIGHALNVKHLLQGGVRMVGERLRVTVQLVDAIEGYHVWSERYDGTLQDVFEIQDRIARATVERLEVHLSGSTRLVKRPTRALEAYNLYLKGRHHLHQWSMDAIRLRLSIDCFSRAIASDASFAQPHAGLADVYMRQALTGLLPPREILPKAKEAALAALAIDETLPEAHSALGMALYMRDWDWTRAERAFEPALQLGPGSELARGRYALLLGEQGRLATGIAEARRAVELAPVSAEAHLYLIQALYVARQFTECVGVARKALELQPTYFPAVWYVGLASGAEGRTADAVSALRQVKTIPHPFTQGLYGWALGLAGEHDEARQVVEQMERRRGQGCFPAPPIAYVHLRLGMARGAVGLL